MEFVANGLADIARSKKRVLYFGWLGEQNFGDDALFYAIGKLVSSRARLYGSNMADKVIAKGVLERHYYDQLMLGGGTFINRNESVVEYLDDKMGKIKELVVFGTGVSSREFWEYMGGWQDMSEAWKRILSRSCHIGVRGPTTLAYLKELGIENALVIGDPVLYLGRENVESKPRTKTIGVNFGFSGDRLWGKSDLEFARKLLGICSLLIEEGFNINFFSVWPKDSQFMRSCLDDFMPAYKGEIFDAWKYSVDDAFAYFDWVDLFMGEKLHAGIAAACTHTPFIMFEYRPKCRDFMESIGEEAMNIRTDSVDSDRVMSLVEALYKDVPAYQERLQKKIAFYKGELEGFADRVFGSAG